VATLLIRADASPSIGTGHIMRCLALAQAWQEYSQGSPVVFVTADNVPALEARLVDEGILIEHLSAARGSTEDALDTARLAHAHAAEWIVADGYQFDAEYQCSLKQHGFRLLSVDDYGHAAHYCCDLLLNQNISAQEGWYGSRGPYTKLLLGTGYALLRREFLARRSWTREISPKARRILVTMGGADPAEATERALDAVELLEEVDFEVKMVIGAANRQRQVLSRRAKESRIPVEVVGPATGMPEMMAWADIAISAAGGTLWELLFMQVPTIAISIAANQGPAARRLGELGATISFDLESLNSADLAHVIQRLIHSDSMRTRMATGGRKIVDGNGASRVVHALKGNQGLSLRKAELSDSRLLWEWANDAEVRRASFHQESIAWETHVKWLNAKLNDSGTMLFIAEHDSMPVGQIRYETSGVEALVSISLDRKIRGKGFSSTFMRLGSQQVFLKTKVEIIHAYIRPDNRGSIRAFQSAGFQASGSLVVHGTEALHFIQQREALNAGNH